MSKLANTLVSKIGQQLQLSWLQSSSGEWFYFFDADTVDSQSQESIDSDYIWLVSQAENTHNVSGYRIENHILETLIEQLAAVEHVAVFGVPHEHKGNGLHVYAQLNRGNIHSAKVSQAINAKLAGCYGEFALPEAITFVDELPHLVNKPLCRQRLKTQVMNSYCAA